MDCALKAEQLTKRYSDFTLDRVSFCLPHGCIMGLIGENGAGKTTTIKLILDLIKRQGGSVQVLGEDCSKVKEHIGVVLEESIFPENLAAGHVNRILKNIYRTWDEEKFHAMARRFELPLQKNLQDYSHGMKTKLALAVALSHATRLLILDEPTSGLDPVVREEILDILMEFIQDEDRSVLMSTHIVSDLEKVADYITFLHRGKVKFSQEKDALLESFALLKCSQADLAAIDPSAVHGVRKNTIGVTALVQRERVKGDYLLDPASLEDIMVYHIKKERLS